jgi:hypothetical protein
VSLRITLHWARSCINVFELYLCHKILWVTIIVGGKGVCNRTEMGYDLAYIHKPVAQMPMSWRVRADLWLRRCTGLARMRACFVVLKCEVLEIVCSYANQLLDTHYLISKPA